MSTSANCPESPASCHPRDQSCNPRVQTQAIAPTTGPASINLIVSRSSDVSKPDDSRSDDPAEFYEFLHRQHVQNRQHLATHRSNHAAHGSRHERAIMHQSQRGKLFNKELCRLKSGDVPISIRRKNCRQPGHVIGEDMLNRRPKLGADMLNNAPTRSRDPASRQASFSTAPQANFR